MAQASGDCGARRCFVAIESGSGDENRCGGSPPHRTRGNGRNVQGHRHPFAGLASSRRVRMNITYRAATPADAATLDRIFESSFCDTFAHLYRPDDLDAFLSSFGIADWKAQLGNAAYAFRL